ncbi:MAG: hypothetical protein KGI28_05155 [Thaumarchaeota archaeon]|nr:hypothetical protein [Nitrososphaerota archaeon]
MQSIQNISHVNYSLETFESFCDEILHLDPKIRFVGIIDDKGKLLTKNTRKGLEVFIETKDLEILLMETALGVRMRREHDDQLGPVNFTISYGRNILSIIFPFKQEMLCVSAEKEIDFSKIPFVILHLLETRIAKKV